MLNRTSSLNLLRVYEQLRDEDEKTRRFRAARADFIARQYHDDYDGRLTYGGDVAYDCFREIQLAHQAGLHLTAIVLTQVFLEAVLSDFYTRKGREGVVGQGLKTLIDTALEDRHLSMDEYLLLDGFRDLSNLYARPSIADEGDPQADIEDPSAPVNLEEDAQFCVRLIIGLIARPPFNEELD
ncbi:MAG: hypothetical protein NXI16_09505 [Alphaproteobacteria bacterium]|nr:hypothetical protein [Alphaproteobacteria bacterium]